jgi:hypothetical protein
MPLLAACGGPAQQGPLPTLASLPSAEATPTTEREGDSSTPIVQGDAVVAVDYSGAISGEFTEALLSAEVGKNYILLFEQLEGDNPVQLRIILAADIEPGTYDIVATQDFQLPEDAQVAAQFDLGFPASQYSGELVLTSIGEDNFTGSLNLTAQDGSETVTVEGEFERLNPAIIG